MISEIAGVKISAANLPELEEKVKKLKEKTIEKLNNLEKKRDHYKNVIRQANKILGEKLSSKKMDVTKAEN